MSNRFDLEQEILSCWDVVTDLSFYISNSDHWDEDERINYLVGIQVKYDKKFDYMFKTFEQYIKNEHTQSNQSSSVTQSGRIRGLNRTEFSVDELNDGYTQ